MPGIDGVAPRILVLRTDKIGDVLTATPIFRALKERFPRSHITAWIGYGTSEVVQDNPHLDAFEEFTRDLEAAGIPDCIRSMRRGHFDAVFFLKEGCGSYVVASYLAGIPVRAGGVSKWYKRLLTSNRHHDWDDDPAHIVCRSYDIVEGALGEKLPQHPFLFEVSAGAEARSISLVPDEGYAVLHPGTGGSARPWLPEQYAEVGRRLRDRLGCQVVVTGLEREAPVAAQVVAGIGAGVIDLAGKTDLAVLAAVLRRASVLISGGTGTLHLAASQGTPTVLIEPTPSAEIRARQWHPWMVPYATCPATDVCPECKHGCTFTGTSCCLSVDPGDVASKAIALVRGCL